MFSLVSQFGAVLLAIQEELRRSVDRSGPVPRTANFLIVSLNREMFLREQKGIDAERVERFRSDLYQEIESFLASNEWTPAGPLSLNLLLRSMDAPCRVRAEVRRSFYTLKVRDDGGERLLPVLWPAAVLGREHDAPPRAFVPVRDGSRSLSREHLLLTFRDLELHVVLRGANPTTLNREALARGADVPLHSGDVLRCGPHTIEIVMDADAETAGAVG